MKKLALNLGELVVESFATQEQGRSNGTVHAAEAESDGRTWPCQTRCVPCWVGTDDAGGDTCVQSCWDLCTQDTCDNYCITFVANNTCPSGCWTQCNTC